MGVFLALLALMALPTCASASVFEDRIASKGLAAEAAADIPQPHPLTGDGSNFEIVANLPLATAEGIPAASDIEMHGDYAFIGSWTEGMVIADISNPLAPRRVGVFHCGGGSQYDVQLSNDGNLALLSTDSRGASCRRASGSMVIDTSDKSNPRMVSFIRIKWGTHTHTLDDRTLYINNYATSRLEVFDLANPAKPRKLSELSFGGEYSVHDSFVDHRPDGRTLLYAASIAYTDVIDVTDPTKPTLLQRIHDNAVTISHQAEPNYTRDTLVVTDEFNGGYEAPGCGGAPVKAGEGLLPRFGDPTDIGAIHFYRLDADGTIAKNGAGDGKFGTYNLPYQRNPSGGCTVHVFWQAPDADRLVAGWYGRGIHVVDYTDPAQARSRGHFIPTGANTWAAKPHRGYIFTGDIARGMDVLRYTGDQWPANAGAQDAQRRAYRRVKDESSQPGDDRTRRRLGGASRVIKLRAPGRRQRTTLTATFRNRKGAIVSKLRFKVRTGRVRRLRLTVAGVPGRYTYVIRVRDRGRVLKRGILRVRKGRARFDVGPGRELVCRIS